MREGTEQSHDLNQVIFNINACHAIGDILHKLIHNGNKKTIVTNDGATVMRELDIVHSLLVDVAKPQDEGIGDGTTTVVVLSCALLDVARQYLEDGVHLPLLRNALT